MFVALVTGSVVATQKTPTMTGYRLRLVEAKWAVGWVLMAPTFNQPDHSPLK